MTRGVTVGGTSAFDDYDETADAEPDRRGSNAAEMIMDKDYTLLIGKIGFII